MDNREDFFRRAYDNPESKISLSCRHCGKPVRREESGVIVGYWTPIWFIAHKECEKLGKADEAYQCQKIDRDCNDCKHFERGQRNKRFSNEFILDPSKYDIYSGNQQADAEEQKRYMKDLLFVGSYDGRCLKFDRPATAWPGQFTGKECFEHRKD